MDWAVLLLQAIPNWIGRIAGNPSFADFVLRATPNWLAPLSSWADFTITATPNFGIVLIPMTMLMSGFFLIMMMEEYDRA